MWFYARNHHIEVRVLQWESWCSPDQGSFQEEVMSLWAILTWWEDWFLPWSDVRAKPFCHGERISSSMSDVSAEPFWCDCRIGSYMIRYKCWMPFLEWRQLVSYQEYSAWCWDAILWENGGTWSVTRNTQPRAEIHSDVIEGCVPTWSDISDEGHSLG